MHVPKISQIKKLPIAFAQGAIVFALKMAECQMRMHNA